MGWRVSWIENEVKEISEDRHAKSQQKHLFRQWIFSFSLSTYFILFLEARKRIIAFDTLACINFMSHFQEVDGLVQIKANVERKRRERKVDVE